MNGKTFTLTLKNLWDKFTGIKNFGSKNYSVQGCKPCHGLGEKNKRNRDYDIFSIH